MKRDPLDTLVIKWKAQAARHLDPRAFGDDPYDEPSDIHQRIAETYTACAKALEAVVRTQKERTR
jgi:hypothetical protein